MAKKKTGGSGSAVPEKKNTAEIMPVDSFFDVETTGMEGMTAEDLSIPFLRIAQSMSAQLEIDKTLKPGMFYNSATGKNYGEKLRVILLGYFPNCVVWDGEGKGANVIKQISREAFKSMQENTLKQNKKGKWVDQEENVYEDTRNFFVFLPDHPKEGTILFPCMSTGISGAKTLNTSARTLSIPGVKKVPIFAGVFELSTGIKENEKGSWYKLGGANGKEIKTVGFTHELYPEYMAIIKSAYEIAQENISNNVSLDYSKVKEESGEEDTDF